ncbi:MAG TPA: hypothetical protein VMT67_00145 [Terriglobales bacterium]|nr:hypothetical protein [Terriglobales bacterium]
MIAVALLLIAGTGWLLWRSRARHCDLCDNFEAENELVIEFQDASGRLHVHNWTPGDGVE